MLSELREQRAVSAECRGMGQYVEPEVPPLEPSLAQVAPFREGDRRSLAVFHAHRISMDDVERQDIASGTIQVARRVDIEVLGEDLKQVSAALADIIQEQFD